MIEILFKLFERFVTAIEVMAGNTTATAISPETETVDGSDIVESPPDERTALIVKLEEHGVTVKPRTRLDTLKKMWAEVEAAGEGKEEEDLFGGEDPPPEKTYTKAQVQTLLKAYIDKGEDDTDKGKRKSAVRVKINEFGAKSVSELAEEHFAAVVEDFI